MEFKIDLVLSSGYVYGKAKCILAKDLDDSACDLISEFDILDNAIKKSISQIDEIKEKEPKLGDYFLAQKYMIQDPMLYKKARDLISKGMSAKNAYKKAMDDFISNLDKSTSIYLKERVVDLEDVVEIVIQNMAINNKEAKKEKYILVSKKLRPSLLINDHDNILGIISNVGGYTSHSAILARAWNIPYVLVSNYEIIDGDIVIIDTRKNMVISNPSDLTLKKCIKDIKELSIYDSVAKEHDDFKFLANVSTNKDIERVLNFNFDGIGLYRTELIFMNSNRPYTFLEQYKIYSEASELMKDKYITFRTFDVGDDKQIAYLKAEHKGIDNYKNNPSIFEDQIKALLKANMTYKNIKIMFPMIETETEFIYLKNWILRIAKENNYIVPQIGMMLETKMALEGIMTFIEPDFFSIGTNDLTHELYNISRDDEDNSVFSYIDNLLESLSLVVDFCNKSNKELSICGELASIKDIAIRFYEIGIKNLSVSPSSMAMLNMAYTEFKNKM